jgi:hypothetical protein
MGGSESIQITERGLLVGLNSIKRMQDGAKMDFRWVVCKGGRWLELAQKNIQ